MISQILSKLRITISILLRPYMPVSRIFSGLPGLVTEPHGSKTGQSLPTSNVKAAPTYKFPADGIVRQALTGHAQEIAQEFKQPLCLVVLRGILGNLEQKRLRKSFQHGQLIDKR